MKYLITGGCGFLGSNLAKEVLTRDNSLVIFDNLSRTGSAQNLEWLLEQGLTKFVHGDIRSLSDIDNLLKIEKPDVIFHLAGQVAMTTSLENPVRDFEINALGTMNLLQSVRNHTPSAVIIYSSTNKVYGDLDQFEYQESNTRYLAPNHMNGFDELVGLNFRSPYGCSKGAADQYMLDFSRNFGLRTIVFRHSSIFGARQFSTFDQGWIGWFVSQALKACEGKVSDPLTISGDGKQVRDVLFASDLVSCYFKAAEASEICSGQAFNIGGGMKNSISLLELFDFLENELNITLKYKKLDWRANDQKIFVADISKAKKFFDWSPKISKEDGLREMINWVKLQNNY